MRHELKTWPIPYAAVLSGEKRHEVRLWDRPFHVGDILHLREFQPIPPRDNDPNSDHPGGEYTGREMYVRITYITERGSWGIPADICIMSIDVHGLHADRGISTRMQAVDAPIRQEVKSCICGHTRLLHDKACTLCADCFEYRED